MKNPCFLLQILLLASLMACSLSVPSKYHTGNDAATDPDQDTAEIDVIGDEGVIPPPTCGNGTIEEGEACDDGNTVDGDGCDADCTFTCSGDGDCQDGNLCNGTEACILDAHTCTTGTWLADGFVCVAEPRQICLGGVCMPSTCGDGFLDTAAGEFCDPPGGSCLGDCTLGCGGDMDCPDDENPCNGDEFCDPSGHVCARSAPLGDGDACGSEPRMICLGGSCQQSLCGDGFVDGGVAPPEECDDGNGWPGDGCENDCTFTCRENADCNDGNACNGEETCDGAAHVCLPGPIPPPGSACDDGRFCTLTDTCNSVGICSGTGNTCDDRIVCTEDTCNEPTDSCTNTILADHCLISGACLFRGALNPENPCRACQPALSQTSWTALPDMSPCADPAGLNPGVCCGGTCRTGGSCCTDADCPAACTGDAEACSDIDDPAVCGTQTGCAWLGTADPTCEGSRSCSDIRGLNLAECQACGCSGLINSGGYWHCTGLTGPTPCGDLGDDMCFTCGCELSWVGSCSGTHPACPTYATEPDCWMQNYCVWSQLLCMTYRCQ
jgi:cysteine-rich repeat protein